MESVSLGSALPAWLLTTPALAPEGLIVILIGSCINAYVLIYIHAPLAVCIPISEWLFLLLAIIQKQHYSKYQKTVDYGMLQIWHPSRWHLKKGKKQRLDMFPHQYGDAALIFEKPLLAFIAFIGTLPSPWAMDSSKTDAQRWAREAFLMFSWQKHSLRNNSKYNAPWHKCEIQNSTIGSQSIHKCECELNWP